MHNRRTENADSREIGLRDALVVAPLVACIVALALYPGLILGRADSSVQSETAPFNFSSSVSSPQLESARHRRAPGWTGYAPIAEVSK
jgi:hypothetical protein